MTAGFVKSWLWPLSLAGGLSAPTSRASKRSMASGRASLAPVRAGWDRDRAGFAGRPSPDAMPDRALLYLYPGICD